MTFPLSWRKVLEEVEIVQETQGAGFTGETRQALSTAASMLPEANLTPNDVRRALSVVASAASIVIFLDEFDRLDRPKASGLFADTIKTLSDQLVSATIVMVGVADNVEELIAEHRSIERALVQIHMPQCLWKS